MSNLQKNEQQATSKTNKQQATYKNDQQATSKTNNNKKFKKKTTNKHASPWKVCFEVGSSPPLDNNNLITVQITNFKTLCTNG